MFDNLKALFSSKPAPADERTVERKPQSAMALLSKTEPIKLTAIAAQWRTLYPGQPPITDYKANADGSAQLILDGHVFTAVQIEQALPVDQLVAARRASWMWQGADDALTGHRAHALITAAASSDVLKEARGVTRLASCYLAAGGGGALYWPNANQVHLQRTALLMSQTKAMPIPLWVSVIINGAASGPFDAVTHGLEALGHKELEVRKTKMPAAKLRETLLDLAARALTGSLQLPHGQTVGPTGQEKWTIRHEPSLLARGRPAIVIGIP